MLKGHPNVQLLRDENIPPLRPNPAAPNCYFAATEQWPPNPLESVTIPPDRPVYYISSGDCRATELHVSPTAKDLGVDAVPVAVIHNAQDPPGERLIYEIQIIEILTSRRHGSGK
jgi:hypothetical protein